MKSFGAFCDKLLYHTDFLLWWIREYWVLLFIQSQDNFVNTCWGELWRTFQTFPDTCIITWYNRALQQYKTLNNNVYFTSIKRKYLAFLTKHSTAKCSKISWITTSLTSCKSIKLGFVSSDGLTSGNIVNFSYYFSSIWEPRISTFIWWSSLIIFQIIILHFLLMYKLKNT